MLRPAHPHPRATAQQPAEAKAEAKAKEGNADSRSSATLNDREFMLNDPELRIVRFGSAQRPGVLPVPMIQFLISH